MRKLVTIFKQFLKGSKPPTYSKNTHTPDIITRDQHTISRTHISSAALKVLYRLHKSGFAAYLVGGSVRDLLLGLNPKDFDVVTDAHPEQIQRLFRNSFIIGRRFRLVHVRFGGEIIEVATFRGHTEDNVGRVHTQHGLLLRDNVYGTLEDDVWRRDFTINALYYNIADFSVIDYTGGMHDLKLRSLRVIGDPTERYREDPARMLRAIRLAGKLNFSIEPETSEAIRKYKDLLVHVPPARLFDKMLKIFHSGKSYATFKLLQEYKVFSVLFPDADEAAKDSNFNLFLDEAFKNTDERINQDKSVNSAFLFSVILWGPLLSHKKKFLEDEELSEHQAFHFAMSEVIQNQLKIISIPRKFTTVIREIWYLQHLLEHGRARRVYKIFHHARFRAGYDFLALRAQSNETTLQDLVKWWSDFQEADEEGKDRLILNRFGKPKQQRKRKKKRSSNDQSISSSGQ